MSDSVDRFTDCLADDVVVNNLKASSEVIIMTKHDRTKHDRHPDNKVRVFKYSEENVVKVEKEMETHWTDGQWGFFGDLPSDGGLQFGWNEDYYSSYAICEVEEEVWKSL